MSISTKRGSVACEKYVPWVGAEFPPRRWQAEALPIAQRSIVSGDWNLIQACTGSGKSRLIAEAVAWAVSAGGFVVVTVPSRDLVRQIAKTLSDRVGARNVGRFYVRQRARQARGRVL